MLELNVAPSLREYAASSESLVAIDPAVMTKHGFKAGDLVRVSADSEGHYFAPVYARMLAIYDHNPDGATSTFGGLARLDDDEN